jgi:hypothetical protein
VNNDGYPDVVVGAPGENPAPTPEDAGRAYVFSLAPPTSVPNGSLAVPRELFMHGPLPNPADGHHIWLGLRAPHGGKTHVRLSLYDARGRRIATVLDETLQSGESRDVLWAPQRKLPSGVYLWRLSAGQQSVQQRMIVAR